MADKRAGEIQRSFRDMGFRLRVDKTRKNETGTEKGRSDLALIRRRLGCFVEIKNGGVSFDTRAWTQQQRDWAAAAEQDGEDYYIALAVGPHPPHRNPAKYRPRKCWLIPRAVFAAAVARVEQHQFQIPYQLPAKLSKSSPKKRAMQLEGLDCVRLFADYEMAWQKGRWVFTKDHEFVRMYLGGNVNGHSSTGAGSERSGEGVNSTGKTPTGAGQEAGENSLGQERSAA